MKLKMFAVKDACLGEYQFWKMYLNDSLARRDFRMALNKPDIPGEDISLYRIGEFDTETGVILPDVVFLEKGVKYVGEN